MLDARTIGLRPKVNRESLEVGDLVIDNGASAGLPVTGMNYSLISGAIAAALPHLPSVKAPPHELELMLRDSGPRKLPSDHPFPQLMQVLRAEEDLSTFDNKMHVLPGFARRIQLLDLAAWLLRRSARVGVAGTLDGLKQYLGSNTFPCHMVVVLTGVTPDRRAKLDETTLLLPWASLPNTSTKSAVAEHFAFGTRRPEAALLERIDVPRKYRAPEVEEYMDPHDEGKLNDAILCLGLSGPTSPLRVASWFEPPEWAPVMVGGYSINVQGGPSRSRPLTSQLLSKAVRLFKKWLALPKSRQTELRIPIGRMITAMRRESLVDEAIDLGIALESVFLGELSDDRTELGFQLRIRGSRWLGGNYGQRMRVYRLLRGLYKARSIAVHTGQLPASVDGSGTRELLNQGYEVTSQALALLVQKAAPDWIKVLLS